MLTRVPINLTERQFRGLDCAVMSTQWAGPWMNEEDTLDIDLPKFRFHAALMRFAAKHYAYDRVALDAWYDLGRLEQNFWRYTTQSQLAMLRALPPLNVAWWGFGGFARTFGASHIAGFKSLLKRARRGEPVHRPSLAAAGASLFRKGERAVSEDLMRASGDFAWAGLKFLLEHTPSPAVVPYEFIRRNWRHGLIGPEDLRCYEGDTRAEWAFCYSIKQRICDLYLCFGPLPPYIVLRLLEQESLLKNYPYEERWVVRQIQRCLDSVRDAKEFSAFKRARRAEKKH